MKYIATIEMKLAIDTDDGGMILDAIKNINFSTLFTLMAKNGYWCTVEYLDKSMGIKSVVPANRKSKK